MTIGEKIKKRRIELKLSQRELSKRMGYLNHSTITKIEAGKVDLSQTRIKQFADVLGVSVAYLMDWEKIREKNDSITDAIVRMRSDEEFLSVVECLMSLDNEKLSSVKQLILTFGK